MPNDINDDTVPSRSMVEVEDEEEEETVGALPLRINSIICIAINARVSGTFNFNPRASLYCARRPALCSSR